MCLWSVLISCQGPLFWKTLRSLGFKWQHTRISCDCSSLKRRVESGSNVSRRKEQVFSHCYTFRSHWTIPFLCSPIQSPVHSMCACMRALSIPRHTKITSKVDYSRLPACLQIASIFHLCVKDYLKSTIKLCPQICSLFYHVTSKDVRKGRQKKQKIPKTPWTENLGTWGIENVCFRAKYTLNLENYLSVNIRFDRTLRDLKVGLGISRTNADSQWSPVYNAFHRNFCCANKTIRWWICKRDLDAANLRPVLEQGCGLQTLRAKQLFFRVNLLYVHNLKM